MTEEPNTPMIPDWNANNTQLELRRQKKTAFLMFGIIGFALLIGAILFITLQKIPYSQIEEVREVPIPLTSAGTEREFVLKSAEYADGDLDAIFYDESTNERIMDFALKSHPSVSYVKEVGLGPQVVMWYDVNSAYALSGALGEPEFTDMRTGAIVDREWKYVYWGNETYEEPIFSCSNKAEANGTSEVCSQTGTETKIRENWLPYNSKDIPKGITRIGIEVINREGEWIDGVWNIGGRKISRHSEWTASLNVDLVDYYNFENNSIQLVDVVVGQSDMNGTLTGGPVNISGRIGSALNFSTGDYARFYKNLTNGSSQGTACMWVKSPSIDDYEKVWGEVGGGSDAYISFGAGSVGNRVWTNGGFLDANVSGSGLANAWNLYCYSWGSLGGRSYQNATFVANNSNTSRPILYGGYKVGENGGEAITQYVIIDEVGHWTRQLTYDEVVQLWNNGSGLTYDANPAAPASYNLSVSLTSPNDNYNSTTSTNYLVVNLTKNGINIKNVSLLVNSTINQTNSSGAEGAYNFTIGLADGVYNWTAQAYDVGVFTQQAVDLKNGYNNGTLINQTNINSSWAKVGDGGVDLDGSGDYINLGTGSSLNLTGELTISAWVNPDIVSGGGKIILSKSEGTYTGTQYELRILSGDLQLVTVNGTTGVVFTAKKSISASEWSHVVGTINSTGYLRVYVNGVVNETGVQHIGPRMTSTEATAIGSIKPSAPNLYFNGSIDDVMLFNRSLSATEIGYIYNNNTAGQRALTTDPSLVSYWTFDDYSSVPAKYLATGRKLSVDTRAPNVNITSPVNGSVIEFQEKNTNLILNWTASDEFLDACWYEWNGVNTTVSCSTNTTSINITDGSVKTVNFYANDTFGIINSSTVNWNYRLFLNYEVFDTPVMEGITSSFSQNFFTNGSDISSAVFTYNSTNYAGTVNNHGGNNFTITRSATAPSVNMDTNITFYWNVSQGGFYYSPRARNQTVLNIQIDNCSINHVVVYNFTIKDEKSLLTIAPAGNNTLGKVDLQINTLGGSTLIAQFNKSYAQINPFAVCINASFSGNLNVDALVEYSADSYQTEFYNIQNNTLNSSMLNRNISLYDLNTSLAQQFRLIVKDSSFLALDDALINIYRKYIDEGIYRITELPKTDANGETTASLVVNDVIYKFVIEKYGQIIKTFDNVRAICQTPLVTTCTIDFNAFATGTTVPDYEENEGFNYTLGYNSSSRIISSSFVLTDGDTANITLLVITEDPLETSVCTDTLSSSSGTLECTVPSTFGNATVLAKLTRDGSLQAQGQVKLDQNPSDIYGGILVILGLFIIGTLVGVGLSDTPVFTVVSLIIGVVLLMALNLVANNGFIGGTATILWIIVALILVLIKAARRS